MEGKKKTHTRCLRLYYTACTVESGKVGPNGLDSE